MSIFKRTLVLIFILAIILACRPAAGAGGTIKVGVVASPPYAMKNANGSWEGISVDFWKAVAEKLGLTCEYQECDQAELIKKVSDGTLSAGVGRLSALEMHNPKIDFTHAYHFSGLALAAPKMTEKQHWLSVLRMLRENNFILLFGLILLTLALSGVTIWFLERRHNPEHFSKNPFRGIGAGLWWSATTITAVGYGDKAPVTFWGRLLAFFWMLAGITLISVFTATITSMCTVSRLSNMHSGAEDLQNKRLGIVAGSAAEEYLQRTGADYQKAATTLEALTLLSAGKLDLVVDDQSALKYCLRRKNMPGVDILPQILIIEGYSFILAKDSNLRDLVNQAIKEYTSLPDWQNVLSRYLGN